MRKERPGFQSPAGGYLSRSTADAHELVHVVGAASPEVREHVLSLVSLLASWGYEVSVVGEVDGDFARDLARVNVSGHAIPIPADAPPHVRYAAARGLGRLLHERTTALVHAHGLRAGLYALLARGARPSPPVICSPNLLPHLARDGSGAVLRRRAYRYVLQRSDRVISCSEVQRTEIAEVAPAAAERSVVIPYGIDARRYHDPLTVGRRRELMGVTPTAAVVGCIADMVPAASLRLFMDAASELCRGVPNLEFVLIGGDADREAHREMAHERGLLGATVFVRAQRDIARVLTPLNVLVVLHPGWPAGQLALQALVRGLGVVALPGGETEEMLAGSEGVTIAAAPEAAALADAILGQLRREAEHMRPADDRSAPAEISQFLVSTQSWDLDRSWQPPQGLADGATSPIAAEAAAGFGITRMARATVAVYHELLDHHAAGGRE